MSTRTPRLVLVTMLAAASAAGCSSRACTSIGAESGVSVDLVGFDRSPPVQVEVCVATTCSTAKVDGQASPVFVANAAIDSATPREVAVTVRRSDGTLLAPPTRTTVTPRTVRPNGPDCEPLAHQGTATVTGVPAAAATTP